MTNVGSELFNTMSSTSLEPPSIRRGNASDPSSEDQTRRGGTSSRYFSETSLGASPVESPQESWRARGETLPTADVPQMRRTMGTDDEEQAGSHHSAAAIHRFSHLLPGLIDEGDEGEGSSSTIGTPSFSRKGDSFRIKSGSFGGSFSQSQVPSEIELHDALLRAAESEAEAIEATAATSTYARRPGTAPLPPLQRPQSATPTAERPSTAVATIMEAGFVQNADSRMTRGELERSGCRKTNPPLPPLRLSSPLVRELARFTSFALGLLGLVTTVLIQLKRCNGLEPTEAKQRS